MFRFIELADLENKIKITKTNKKLRKITYVQDARSISIDEILRTPNIALLILSRHLLPVLT